MNNLTNTFISQVLLSHQSHRISAICQPLHSEPPTSDQSGDRIWLCLLSSHALVIFTKSKLTTRPHQRPCGGPPIHVLPRGSVPYILYWKSTRVPTQRSTNKYKHNSAAKRTCKIAAQQVGASLWHNRQHQQTPSLPSFPLQSQKP